MGGLSDLAWAGSSLDRASGFANVRGRLRMSMFIAPAVPAGEMLANDLDLIPPRVLSGL
jgi:hypothetical protein